MLSPDEIAAARKRLGLTTGGLARALRLGDDGRKTVRRWEEGERSMGGGTAIALLYMLRDGKPLDDATIAKLRAKLLESAD